MRILWAISIQHEHLARKQRKIPFTLSLRTRALCCISLLGVNKDFRVGGLLFMMIGYLGKLGFNCGSLCNMCQYSEFFV